MSFSFHSKKITNKFIHKTIGDSQQIADKTLIAFVWPLNGRTNGRLVCNLNTDLRNQFKTQIKCKNVLNWVLGSTGVLISFTKHSIQCNHTSHTTTPVTDNVTQWQRGEGCARGSRALVILWQRLRDKEWRGVRRDGIARVGGSVTTHIQRWVYVRHCNGVHV